MAHPLTPHLFLILIQWAWFKTDMEMVTSLLNFYNQSRVVLLRIKKSSCFPVQSVFILSVWKVSNFVPPLTVKSERIPHLFHHFLFYTSNNSIINQDITTGINQRIWSQTLPTLSSLLLQQVCVQSQVALLITQRLDPLLLLRQLVGRVPWPAVILREVM